MAHTMSRHSTIQLHLALSLGYNKFLFFSGTAFEFEVKGKKYFNFNLLKTRTLTDLYPVPRNVFDVFFEYLQFPGT